MSIKLTQYAFYKKEKNFPFLGKSKLTEHKLVLASHHLQFWTHQKKEQDKQDSMLKMPETKLALLTSTHLYLIPSKLTDIIHSSSC
jgi:hypothetical protein